MTSTSSDSPEQTLGSLLNTSGHAWTAPTNGIVGGYPGNNVNILRAMTAFSAIAWYNAIEILILVLLRFKKRSSLYFWSLVVTAAAILIYQFGSWAKMLQVSQNEMLTVTFINVGWIFMVAGQSLVLYSRLHLITHSRFLLKFVLWMIIVNTVVQYIPTTALTYGANLHPDAPSFVNGYNIMERIQMTFFTVQELIISIIYLVESGKFLRTVMEEQTRKLMYELLAVNIVLIVLDAALLSVEYEDLYQIELTLKGMVYSIKLKLELGVLSKLVKVLRTRRDSFLVTNPEGELDLKRFASTQVHNTILRSTTQSPRQKFSLARHTSHGTHHDEDTTAIDFASFSNGSPLRGPTEEEADAYPGIPELAHRRHSSRHSSVSHLYPGRISGFDEKETK